MYISAFNGVTVFFTLLLLLVMVNMSPFFLCGFYVN